MIGAFVDRLRHWREVWGAAMEQDRKRVRVHRNRDELEFLPAAVEVLETPASPVGRAFAYLIALVFVTALAWAWFGEINTVAVAQGRIIPGGRVKVIQPLEAGVVRAIHVDDGRHVRKGDLLIQLDPTETGADQARLGRDLMAARLDAARLQALILNPGDPAAAFVPPDDVEPAMLAAAGALMVAQAEEYREAVAAIGAEVRQRTAELGTVRARIARFKDTLPLLQKRVDAWAYLAKKEYASKLRLTELQEDLVARERDLTIEQRRIVEVREAIGVLKRRRAEKVANFAGRTNADLAEAVTRGAGLEQELRKASERSRQRVLRSPVDGIVQQLAIHTVGGVVQPAQALMVIVPDDSTLEVEAMVLNKDVGFVRAGQPVAIKIESFPFTKYGLIDGTLRHLSADSVQDEKLGLVYPARIRMHAARILVRDRWAPLAAGMTVTAEVDTGTRRAIEFFLSPFMEYRDEALRER